jgi:hypothetical protein
VFTPSPGQKYDMPAVFGPSPFPDQTVFGRVEMVSIGFVTTRTAAEALVPHHFEVDDDPVVTVSRVSYADVDYLAGRGYEELTVGIAVRHRHGDDVVSGLYMPVLWVDHAAPIIAGRELMGYAKIQGELAPPVRDGRVVTFGVSEFGTPLVEARVEELQPLTGEQLVRLGHATRPTSVLGWKFIMGPGGSVDADYATQIVLNLDFDEGWSGSGSLTWHEPDWKEAPFSARIATALKALPVVRWRRAFVGGGSGDIDRAATRRLG